MIMNCIFPVQLKFWVPVLYRKTDRSCALCLRCRGRCSLTQGSYGTSQSFIRHKKLSSVPLCTTGVQERSPWIVPRWGMLAAYPCWRRIRDYVGRHTQQTQFHESNAKILALTPRALVMVTVRWSLKLRSTVYDCPVPAGTSLLLLEQEGTPLWTSSSLDAFGSDFAVVQLLPCCLRLKTCLLYTSRCV